MRNIKIMFLLCGLSCVYMPPRFDEACRLGTGPANNSAAARQGDTARTLAVDRFIANACGTTLAEQEAALKALQSTRATAAGLSGSAQRTLNSAANRLTQSSVEQARRQAQEQLDGVRKERQNEFNRSSGSGARGFSTMDPNEERQQDLFQLLQNEHITTRQFEEAWNAIASPQVFQAADLSPDNSEITQANSVHDPESNVRTLSAIEIEKNISLDKQYARVLDYMELAYSDEAHLINVFQEVKKYHDSMCHMLYEAGRALRDCWPAISHDTYDILTLVITEIDNLYKASRIFSNIKTTKIHIGTSKPGLGEYHLDSLVTHIEEGISSVLSIPNDTLSEILGSESSVITESIIRNALELLDQISNIKRRYNDLESSGIRRLLSKATEQCK